MTVVDMRTGEVVNPLDRDEAERLSIRISARLDTIADNYVAVMPMIREAISRDAHAALGYRSAGEYASERFGDALSKLDPSMRREVVRELTEAGMSTRAIAPVVGVSKDTVQRDFARVSHETPQAPETSPAGLSAAGSATSQDEDRETTDHVESAPRPTVTGIDGKTYARPSIVRQPSPREVEWDEQDRAEELADNLASNLSLLYAVTNPERRAEYIAAWPKGTKARAHLGQKFVTPQHMRDLAEALNTFAKEWEQANV